jgi:uncharacterized integral membrane protein
MQFLKTLFWVLVAVVAVVFAMRNWTVVPIALWGGLEVDAKLPVLLLAAFLIGLLPPLVVHRATRWSLRRRLEAAERALAETRAAAVPPPVAAPTMSSALPDPAAMP